MPITSTAIANGAWTSSGTWNNGVPGAGDTAIIGPWTVTLAADQSVAALTLGNGADLKFTAPGILTVSGALTINNTVSIEALANATVGCGSFVIANNSLSLVPHTGVLLTLSITGTIAPNTYTIQNTNLGNILIRLTGLLYVSSAATIAGRIGDQLFAAGYDQSVGNVTIPPVDEAPAMLTR